MTYFVCIVKKAGFDGLSLTDTVNSVQVETPR
jgi:hypothetical protein